MSPSIEEAATGVRVILWDALEEIPHLEGIVCTWNGRGWSEPKISLLDYVEEFGEQFREEFLEWSANFGRTIISGRRLIAHFSLGDGFSYWWMTPFVEKSPWKSPWIKDALRLFALKKIVAETGADQFVLVSRDERLHKTLRDFCENLRLEYQRFLPEPKTQPNGFLRALFSASPHLFQGAATLARQVVIRRAFISRKAKAWQAGEKSTTVLSYFFHLEKRTDNQYRSRFWGNLTDLVKDMGLAVNWVHIFYPHDSVPKGKDALRMTDAFNRNATSEGVHRFIDEYLTWRGVARVIRSWIHLTWVSWRLGVVLRSRADAPLCLWPLVANEWKAATCGSIAVMNLLWKELFDAALWDAPHQAQGIYLWENQSWERAWIHAWRKHGHGKLTGVAHSTIRFWDLRYFDSRTGCDPQDPFPIPQPDAVALNGKASIEALAGFGTAFEIQECEALRFQDCQDCSSSRNDRKTERDGVVRVLVLGDFLPAETKRMLDLLNAAAPEISSAFSFTLKPHPNHLPDLSEYKGIEMDVVTEHLSSLLPFFDVAYASNITSAAVDAYLAGLSVVVLYPDDDLNYSPLRNREGVHFVTSVSQFIEALKIPRPESRGPAARDMFRFDPEFPLWRKILEPGVQKVT